MNDSTDAKKAENESSERKQAASGGSRMALYMLLTAVVTAVSTGAVVGRLPAAAQDHSPADMSKPAAPAGDKEKAAPAKPAQPAQGGQGKAIRWKRPAADKGGFWSSPSNWEGGRVPGPGDDAVIPAATAVVFISAPAGVRGLSVEGVAVTQTAEFVVEDLHLNQGARWTSGPAALVVRGSLLVTAGELITPFQSPAQSSSSPWPLCAAIILGALLLGGLACWGFRAGSAKDPARLGHRHAGQAVSAMASAVAAVVLSTVTWAIILISSTALGPPEIRFENFQVTGAAFSLALWTFCAFGIGIGVHTWCANRQ